MSYAKHYRPEPNDTMKQSVLDYVKDILIVVVVCFITVISLLFIFNAIGTLEDQTALEQPDDTPIIVYDRPVIEKDEP